MFSKEPQKSLNKLVQRARNFRVKFNGSYRTKSFLLKEFSLKQRNADQKINTKNMKRDLRRQIIKLYFAPEQNKIEKRKTSNIMSTSGFLLQMKKRNGFLKLIEPFTNFTQCVETILFDEDKKKLFIEKYSVCELVLIIVDLMQLRDITFQFIKNPQSLNNHLKVQKIIKEKERKKFIKKQISLPETETFDEQMKEEKFEENIKEQFLESQMEESRSINEKQIKEQAEIFQNNFCNLNEENWEQHLAMNISESSLKSLNNGNEEMQ